MDSKETSYPDGDGREPTADAEIAQIRHRLGQQLRRLRRERKLTQEDLAERSNLSVDTVRRVERGAFSPSLDTVAKLAVGLAVSLRTLIGKVDGGRSPHAAELCDFLSTRSRRELRIANRVLHSLCDALGSE